jgi:PLP dependent protein
MDSRGLEIRQNIAAIQERIRVAEKRAHRSPGEVRLLAVTKNASLADIRAAVEAGVRMIGENKVQDAKAKFAQIGPVVSWHMLGHVQSNKSRSAAAIFDMIESVDSPRAADALSRAAEGLDRQLDVLVEVNIGGEEQKFGVSPEAAPGLCDYVDHLPDLRLRGLMAMAPYVPDPETVRPFFRHMRQLFHSLAEGRDPARWSVLSMGMTHDFEVAVEEGATLLRIGTGIFAAPSAGGRA